MRGLSLLARSRANIGAAPGTLVAEPHAEQPTIRLITYGPDDFSETTECDAERAIAARGTAPVVWIDVSGLADTALIARIGEAFGLHSLALEDVVTVDQRPKAEAYDNHLLVIVKMMVEGREPLTEQLAIFVGEGYVISFQERRGDCLESIRERLRHGRGRLRGLGADYLAYVLIDAVIDGYFPVLEDYGEEIEELEDAIVEDARGVHIASLHRAKRNLLMVRRAVWPTRDLLNAIIRDENPLITEHTRLFARDAYDHAVQIMDIVETYREIASGLVEVYLSSQGARMNEIMKVLTVIATIFIPLGFFAGLWGMNFDRSSPWNMPELGWRYGYPAALAIMLCTGAGLLWAFWRRGWLGGAGAAGRKASPRTRSRADSGA